VLGRILTVPPLREGISLSSFEGGEGRERDGPSCLRLALFISSIVAPSPALSPLLLAGRGSKPSAVGGTVKCAHPLTRSLSLTMAYFVI